MNNKYDNLCELVDKIKLNDSIGKGSFGKAFDFKIDGDDMEYVLKVIPKSANFIEHNDCKQESFLYIAKNGVSYAYENCYICKGDNTEYFISRLASNTGSDNFLHANSIGLCSNQTYILMEKADGTLEKLFEYLSEEDITSIIIQIMHAIYLMHELKINHNDLHTGNIFLKENKEVDKIVTLKVEDNYYSFPVGKYIAKIGDWGSSNCFDENTVILNNKIIMKIHQIPDYFCPAYDIGTFVGSFIQVVNTNSLLIKIYDWIENNKIKNYSSDRIFNNNDMKYISEDFFMDCRTCNQEFPHVTALTFFNHEIMNKFKN